MYKAFKELNISHPRTYLYKSKQEVIDCPLKYPFLIKEEGSASATGIHKIEDRTQLDSLLNSNYFIRNEYVIVQELINMKRDLRVTLVGDEIIHHYWRINLSDEWKPTSTGFGSKVDFANFPENSQNSVLAFRSKVIPKTIRESFIFEYYLFVRRIIN